MKAVHQFIVEHDPNPEWVESELFHMTDSGKYYMGAMIIGHNPFVKVRSDERGDEYESRVCVFPWKSWCEFRYLLKDYTMDPKILAALRQLELIGHENYPEDVQKQILGEI